jgi:Pectate lyase superfamily protein
MAAPVIADFVQESTLTTGTGDLALGGAELGGYATFASVLTDGAQALYVLQDPSNSAREVGIGTYHAGTNTLSRTQILASTNGGSVVNLLPGTKDVYIDVPASYLRLLTNYQAANQILAGPATGAAAAPAYRALVAADIPSLDASVIATGTLATARIPSLDASQITTGTLATGRIPNLDASVITTGTFGTTLIPALDASKITTGTFAAARIPSLDASKITTGTLQTVPVHDKGGAIFDVKAYGAVGDGVTDDTTAIFTNAAAAAQAATPNGCIYLPPGTYKIAGGGGPSFPQGTVVEFAPGAQLLIIGGNVQFRGAMRAGRHRIFAAASTGVPFLIGTPDVDVVYPEWWGAYPDGSTDCTAAIQAALDFSYLQANKFTVELGAGNYKFSQLTLRPFANLYGQGRTTTTLTTTINDGASAALTHAADVIDKLDLGGFQLLTTQATPGYGLDLGISDAAGAGRNTIRDIWIKGPFLAGIRMQSTNTVTFDRVWIEGPRDGVYIAAVDGNTSVNNIVFHGGRIAACTRYGVNAFEDDITAWGSTQVSFEDVDFESNGVEDVHVDGPQEYTLDRCWFEFTPTHVNIVNGQPGNYYGGHRIINCHSGPTASGRAVQVGHATNVRVIGGHLDAALDATPAILLGANSSYCSVEFPQLGGLQMANYVTDLGTKNIGFGGDSAGMHINTLGSYSGRQQTPTYAATMTVDVTKGNSVKFATVHATGNATLNLTGFQNADQRLDLIIVNDNTSGKTITFGTGFAANGNLVGVAGQTTRMHFVSDGAVMQEFSRLTF